MRAAFGIAAVAALLPPVLSQGGNVPSCVQDCLTAATPAASGECSDSDTTCLCGSEDFITAAAVCYADNCDPDDVQIALTMSEELCSNSGVSISIAPSASRALASATGEGQTAAADASDAAESVSEDASDRASDLDDVASTAAGSGQDDDDSGAQRNTFAGLAAVAGVAGLVFMA